MLLREHGSDCAGIPGSCGGRAGNRGCGTSPREIRRIHPAPRKRVRTHYSWDSCPPRGCTHQPTVCIVIPCQREILGVETGLVFPSAHQQPAMLDLIPETDRNRRAILLQHVSLIAYEVYHASGHLRRLIAITLLPRLRKLTQTTLSAMNSRTPPTLRVDATSRRGKQAS